jgi:hypothetical protein
VPSGASSATSSARAGTTCKRAAPLPSYACGISASYTYDISISCADSPSTGASWCTTIDREVLGGLGRVTRACSRWHLQGWVQGCHRVHSRPTNNQNYRGMTPSTQKSPFESRDENRRSRSHISNRQLHTHTGRTPVGRLYNGPSWAGAPFPRDMMRVTPLS